MSNAEHYQKQSLYNELWPPLCESCGKISYNSKTPYTSRWHNKLRICSKCFKKSKRKKFGRPQAAKPLHPRSTGYHFVFDKMIQPSQNREYHLTGNSILPKDKVYIRQHRKRQRRVNKFLIQEQLTGN